MALKSCRECGKEVSTDAKICPHCGAGKPTTQKPSVKETFAGFALLALIVAGTLTMCSGSDEQKSASVEKPAAKALPVPHAVRLDEHGLTSAVGRKPAYKYSLDDGFGLNFRGKNEGPDFSLEFRSGRINVAWNQYLDEPGKFDAMNLQNLQWAEQVLGYALGKESADRVMESFKKVTPVAFEQLGHEVRLVVSSGNSALLTIRQ